MKRRNKKHPRSSQEDPNKTFQHGILLQSRGELNEALSVFTDLAKRLPHETPIHNRLGQVAFSLGNLGASAQHFVDSLLCSPNQPDTLSNLGVIYRRLGKFDQALECQNRAIELDPTYGHAYNNLGILLNDHFDDPEKAFSAFEQAITLEPTLSDAHYNKGNLFKNRGNHTDAIACYEVALSLNPNHAGAHLNKAIAYGGLKQYAKAAGHYQKAIELGTTTHFVLGQYLYNLLHIAAWSDFSAQLKLLVEQVNSGIPAVAPFQTHSLFDDPRLQKLATKTFVETEYPSRADVTPPKTYPHHKRIRIGYFSSDYWNHPVTHLMLGLFKAHDRARFEIIAFSFGNPAQDRWHESVRANCDQFIDVSDLSDEALCRLARQMEIDIAVDLNGYTEHRRTEVFAMRVAPVQVSYIGYLGTMGAPFMDYLIADELIIPADYRQFYSEKIIYLPSYQCNDPQLPMPIRQITRSECGLPEDTFVYCSFNNNYKINPEIFVLWLRILNSVPKSVLWLYSNNETAKENLRNFAKTHGIDPDRIIFAAKVPFSDHLARQQLGDLFLDTLPYNAGATASNALRMGLPVLTRAGHSFAGRMGASLLHSVGLTELITETAEAYENQAVNLAQNKPLMESIKQKLSENLSNTKLFDNISFAQHVEAAFTTIHQRACSGHPPMHLLIKQT